MTSKEKRQKAPNGKNEGFAPAGGRAATKALLEPSSGKRGIYVYLLKTVPTGRKAETAGMSREKRLAARHPRGVLNIGEKKESGSSEPPISTKKCTPFKALCHT